MRFAVCAESVRAGSDHRSRITFNLRPHEASPPAVAKGRHAAGTPYASCASAYRLQPLAVIPVPTSIDGQTASEAMMAQTSVFSRAVHSKRTKTIIVAAVLLVALCGCGLWLLSRETTLIHAANALSQRLDGRLQTVDLHGSLLGKITASEIHYQDRFGKVAIKDARLEWRPIRLLIGQVAVGAMSANSVTLELAKSEDESRNPPESLAAPISFAVTDFQIAELSIIRPDATQEIRGLRAAFSGNKKELKDRVKSR